ncbi:hypothetical protein [Allorhodopirellula solitaria]|uniref:Uncharacterized protein n=1 Tax=Allorhodopirellula solitaria TaxID=2527987 RepID=A0A5C5YDB1_9BACT|nr:hypothetical protein [Allorhodopirellula solitaria]TWT73350.1 hypothetical protein CA85_18190 [Allorhodopirellula solitaria]
MNNIYMQFRNDSIRFSILLSLVVVLGCRDESATAKQSHFEHDHGVAAHWPSDLPDAAKQLRSRLDRTSTDDPESDELQEEMADLVSWIPEVAADSSLSENDWIPINEAAKSLSKKLQPSGHQWTQSAREQAYQLCDLIEKSESKPTAHPVTLESKSS